MKTTWGLIAFMLLSLSSCNQDDIESLGNSEDQSLKVVSVIDGKITTENAVGNINTMALQFSSEAELQDMLDKLSDMSVNERIAFTDDLGFVSLEKLLKLADAELDSIGDAATSEADFRAKYAIYKEKYSKIFVFNNKKLDDLSPYIPASTENDKFAYLVGGNYSIVIGNSVRKIGFSNEMREEDNLIFNKDESAQTRGTEVNGFIVTVGKKKTIFRADLKSAFVNSTTNRRYIEYHFGAQKKLWYGWRRDSSRDLIITDLKVSINGGYDRRHFPQAQGDFNLEGGSVKLNPGDTRTFSGTVYVWTDQTVEHDNQGNIVYTDPIVLLERRVLCYENKAYPCQISYYATY